MKRSTSSFVGILVAVGACFAACSSESDNSSSTNADGAAASMGEVGGGATASTTEAGGGAATSSGSGAGGSLSDRPPCPDFNHPGNASTGEGGSSPLHVAEASILSSTEVLLAFTEPLAPTTGVKPTDFRLSVVRTVSAQDPVFEHCRRLGYTDKDGYFYCCGGTYFYASGDSQPGDDVGDLTFYYATPVVAAIEPVDNEPNQLSLRLAAPFGSGSGGDVCAGGLYLHYAEGVTPVEDLSGDKLNSISPEWVHPPNANPFGPIFGTLPAHPIKVGLTDLAAICCTDGRQDDSETDVDCGGALCSPCADGKKCSVATDCEGGVCGVVDGNPPGQGQCAPSTCSDATQAGGETGVDCGGPCPACLGAACAVPSDCASGACAGTCVSPVITTISAGLDHTCALLQSGKVQCWGLVGDGTPFARPLPVNATELTVPAAAIVAGIPRDPIPGTFFEGNCAITQGGSAVCWSSSATSDSLGTASAISVSFFGLFGIQTGSVVQWTSASGDSVPVAGLGSNVRAVAAGGDFACAITSSSGVRCWGADAFGQLGNGTTGPGGPTPVDVVGLDSGVTAIATGSETACAINASGGALCWGANGKGQLGAGTGTDSNVPLPVVGLASGVTAITVGGASCALTTGGAAKCWGDNTNGQIGDGTQVQKPSPVGVSGLDSGVRIISAGDGHTCALTQAGRVLCWGRNEAGQLGDGTTTTRVTPVEVVGL